MFTEDECPKCGDLRNLKHGRYVCPTCTAQQEKRHDADRRKLKAMVFEDLALAY